MEKTQPLRLPFAVANLVYEDSGEPASTLGPPVSNSKESSEWCSSRTS